MKHFAALLFLACAVQVLYCQDIECDRPDQGETPAIVPAGLFQMESGFSYEHESRNMQNLVHPSTLVKFGLGNVGELRVEIESETQRSIEQGRVSYQPGIKPVAFGVKVKICEEQKARPKAAVIVMANVPVAATKGFEEPWPSPEIRLLLQHSLSEKLTLSCNLGAYCNSSNFTPTGLYTLTTEYSLSKKFDCFVEVYGFVPYRVKEHAEHADGGFMFKPVPNVMVDINAGIDLNKQPGWFGGCGISFRLPH